MMIGRRLNDRYKILKLIGTGGMANVYLARDMILDRDVAVKMLKADFSNDPEFLRRFQREAYSVTSLSHPNIVSSYDVGEEDGLQYIVMEYVEGETLKEYIQHHTPIRPKEVIRIMEQLASALAHAHHFQIVHRDVKPQNILINKDGNVKVTDFGIATASTAATITQTNSVLGSVHYLSPEQARGGVANKKSDIYSLGIVMFELLTGKLPFSGESAVAVALKHLQSEVPPPTKYNPEIPQSVENIVLKATAKDIFYRYDSADEMKLDLQTALDTDRLNEKPFVIPTNDDETKIIPILKDIPGSINDDTVVVPIKMKSNQSNQSNQPKDNVKKAPDKNLKRKKKNSFAKFIIGTFIALLISGLLAITLIPALFLPEDVEIPDVKNMTYESAVTLLASKGLKISDPKEIYDNEIDEGKVVQTSPNIGETVKENSSVTIYKSKGKKSSEMEDLKGFQYSTIKSRLQDDYRSVTTHFIESDETEGEVIDQSPNMGAEVVPSETDLNVWISKGTATVIIRDLTGWSRNDVEDYAGDNNLVLSVTKAESETIAEDHVISQSPAATAAIKEGGKLRVVISSGKPKEKTKKVTINVQVPYTPTNPSTPQLIEVFITDKNNNGDKPAISKSITETTTIPVEVTIDPGQKASYKIVKDGQVIAERDVSYPSN
ncbi:MULTISPECIES: Stk1 family PASTA domain-containing Ser/Thr kinase [unclassified Bacillus (in: firmicutes)]|uniref:Stk1 family PASTA domain-containing Ser/Thr kinase n=1 Tax=unclassified Bacillus (in: firmicutes) TaxID=185979 RepID=UPI000BEFDA94|nr:MULTISPECIES: Stk1 family PASTA domain-containing Ser/Thr kinase [unclassified Bacillus (in: firmicutes)]PEJ60419.1 serine/threonine protein kinase [Bacillus sp. AFS002410]PEL10812.1 serine/threonine protein kinase [Bacillus sp. AFS017336]